MSNESDHRAHANDNNPSILAMLSSVSWPLLLGLAATSLFFVLVYQGPLNLPIMHRYFASHPVTFCETGLFFIGLSALFLKCLSALSEHTSLSSIALPTAAHHESVERASRLLDIIDGWSDRLRKSILGRRLQDALEFVERGGTASGLSEELKYLADVEAARQQDSFSLVRIVVWATPMLGFLGTVMGITEALGDLSANAGALQSSPESAIQGLLGGLYIAFDTTALALTLSMVLMFIQFFIERIEVQQLAEAENQANAALMGRFLPDNTSNDPHVAVIERMAKEILNSTEQLVQTQAQLWHGTVDAAHQQWSRLLEATGGQVQAKLHDALDVSLRNHAQQLIDAERGVAGQIRQEWERVQAGLSQHASLLLAQQTEVNRNGETLMKVLAATGDVMRLEQALNSNLSALAGSKNFEDTVMSLAAAIHLLNSRLVTHDNTLAVELSRNKAKGKAA